MPGRLEFAHRQKLQNALLDLLQSKVVGIEREGAYSFARIFAAPIAGVENFGEVMILDPRQPLPPPVLGRK